MAIRPPLPPLSVAAPVRGAWSDFKAFLIKQNAIALALAVVIGGALDRVVKSLVEGLIMPIVAVAAPDGQWATATWNVGPFRFGIGLVAAAIINFFIIGFVAWRLAKAFIKPEVASTSSKPCPFCRMAIDAAATRCAHCTSQLAA